MITFTKNITFYLFSFFITVQSILYSMDLPQAKSIIPSNDKIQEKKKMLGDFFGSLPTEVILYSFQKSTPGMRNGLRPANKTLSKLFSWENVHPFVLSKELIAHPHDIQSLIAQCMHKTNKSESENAFIERYQNKFFSYQILGEPRFLVLEYTNVKPDLYMFNHASRKKQNIHPLLEVCLARNAAMVKDYLESVDYKMFNLKNGLSLDIFRDAIQILIQNNDVASLELIFNGNKIGKEYKQCAVFPVCSKLIQAGVVCASRKTLPYIIRYYKRKNINAMSAGGAYKEEDWIAKMLEQNPTLIDQPIKKAYFCDIIKSHYPVLKDKHKDNEVNFEASLYLLLNENTLKTLETTNKNEFYYATPKKNKSHNNCLIM